MENLALTHPDLFEAARQAFARTLDTVVFSKKNRVLPIRDVRGFLVDAMYRVDPLSGRPQAERIIIYNGIAEMAAQELGYVRRPIDVLVKRGEDGEMKTLVFKGYPLVGGSEYWIRE